MTPRSPGWDIALPVLEMRARNVTCVCPASDACGFMAVDSSSTKLNGNWPTVVRTMASGMREPWVGVA